MIVDQLKNINRYLGINSNLDKAIHFILTQNLFGLPMGHTEIDGDNVFVNHFNYTTGDANASFENHHHYLDLHIVLSGDEMIAISPVETLEAKPYVLDGDYEELSGKEQFRFPLLKDSFAILFPSEGHLPKLPFNNPTAIDKLVFKILLE